MERYDSYKDSGVDWIGQIPEHWEILPGKYLFSENKKLNDHQDRKVLSLSYGNIILKKLSNEGLLPATYDNYQLILKNYIVIRCTDLQNDKVSLRTSISKFDGIITNAYLALVPFSCTSPDYLNYLLRHWDNSKEIYRYGSGVRQNLSWNDLKKLLLIVPPLSEQQAIAAYLDEETGKLDAAVEKLERMVDVLKERKQLIISKAVTRGLDDSVPLKDSGVEWIGQIPEHWQKFRFKNLLQIKSKKSDSFFKVGLENIESQTGRFLSTSTLFDGDGIAFESGDILYGKLRPYLQKAWLANCSGSAVGDFFVYKVQPICVDRFMLYVLLSKQFTEVCTGATYGAKMPRVASEFISALPYFLPPIAEQQAIAAYLDEKVGKLDEAIEKQLRMIELLKERKQILISDVVTGKIKVA